MFSLLQPTSLKTKHVNRYHKILGGRNAKYVVVGAFSRTHVCLLLILCKAAGQGKNNPQQRCSCNKSPAEEERLRSSVGHELDVTARKTSSFGRSRGHSAVGCHPNGAGRTTDELTLSVCEIFIRCKEYSRCCQQCYPVPFPSAELGACSPRAEHGFTHASQCGTVRYAQIKSELVLWAGKSDRKTGHACTLQHRQRTAHLSETPHKTARRCDCIQRGSTGRLFRSLSAPFLPASTPDSIS